MPTDEAAATPEIEAYFDNVPENQRAALRSLQRSIRNAAPGAVEVISYGLPTFKLYGSLVALGAAKNHCAFYHMSSSLRDRLRSELDSFDTSKGTIRFSPDKPLPENLVQKIVRMRIEENIEIVRERDRRKAEKKQKRSR